MSTINTENLTLYANTKLYNGSRYVYYQTGRDYETWLTQNSNDVISLTVNFKSLSENMELNYPVKDLLKYSICTLVFVLFFGIYFYGIDWIVLLVRSLAK